HNELQWDRVVPAHSLPNPIEDYDSVVDRITGDGQHRANDNQRQLATEQSKCADRQNHVMQQGNDRGHSKREFKSCSDVNEDTDNPEAQSDQGIACQLVTNNLADLVILLDAEFRFRKFLIEQFLDL